MCLAIQSSPDFLMGDSLIYFLRVTIPKGVGVEVCASQAVAELKIPFRILIADDNALVRTAMREVLEEVDEQWEIVEAADGRDAVRKAQQLRPELVILDLVMPVSGGLTASRQISKLLPRVPILLHTLYWSEEIELEAAKAGVRKVVRKSETHALVSAVQDVPWFDAGNSFGGLEAGSFSCGGHGRASQGGKNSRVVRSTIFLERGRGPGIFIPRTSGCAT